MPRIYYYIRYRKTSTTGSLFLYINTHVFIARQSGTWKMLFALVGRVRASNWIPSRDESSQSIYLINWVRKSMGSGKMMVEFFSAEMVLRVCTQRTLNEIIIRKCHRSNCRAENLKKKGRHTPGGSAIAERLVIRQWPSKPLWAQWTPWILPQQRWLWLVLHATPPLQPPWPVAIGRAIGRPCCQLCATHHVFSYVRWRENTYISTRSTLMPHDSVASSNAACNRHPIRATDKDQII